MRRLAVGAWVIGLMLWAGTAGAMTLRPGDGRVVTLAAPVANVFVANPAVAQARPASPSSLFVFGIAPGHTTIAALDSTGHPVAMLRVAVLPSQEVAGEARAALARVLPGVALSVAQEPNGLLVTGTVATPAEAARAIAVARGFVPAGQSVDNQITVRASIQVTLQVRIVQMSRTISDKLGIDWQALGTIGSIGMLPALNIGANGLTGVPCPAGTSMELSILCRGTNLNGTLDALAQDGLVRMLAEPNLTVISGQKASFLVGGQFPVPIPAGPNNGVTITYKNFGVSLNFRPTVFSHDRIAIHVAPEVSQISNANAVSIPAGSATFVVPSLTVSRAETTVQLGSGQSFAIGGLLQDTINDGANGIPNLSNVPILGAMFRDDQFSRQQTELVIIVTPIIVRPVDDPAALHLPAPHYHAPSDFDRLLRMRQVGHPDPSLPRHVPGDAGFILK